MKSLFDAVQAQLDLLTIAPQFRSYPTDPWERRVVCTSSQGWRESTDTCGSGQGDYGLCPLPSFGHQRQFTAEFLNNRACNRKAEARTLKRRVYLGSELCRGCG